MHRASCRLPKKPSALILLALADLAKAERTPGDRIDMRTWHIGVIESYDPETCKVEKAAGNGSCVVCLAGSVMAFSLNVPRTRSIEPNEYPDEVERALLAINSFRVGEIGAALHEIDVSDTRIKKAAKAFEAELEDGSTYFEIPMPPYGHTAGARAKFKTAMRAMAKKLASVGL